MEKDHFEILLEEMKSNFRLAFEGLDGVNVRLDKTDGRLGNIEVRLERVEVGQVSIGADLSETNRRVERLEAGQEAIKSDVRETNRRLEGLESGQEVIKSDLRDVKRNTGLLNSIANDHESRLQGVESKLKDHLENHS
jgi:chromosome segregation ATPase